MYLVDTHVPLWVATDDDRLGEQARSILTSDALRYVSAVSVVEWTIKIMRGGLVVEGGVERLIEPLGFRNLAVNAHDAIHIADFPTLVRHDPFDRILLAQAKAASIGFLTADRVLLGLDLPWIIDATN